MTDDQLFAELHKVIKSVWALEVLLLMRREPGEAWGLADLVQELRSSETAVGDGLAGLQISGLVAQDSDGRYRYAPASPELERLSTRIEALYATKPLAVAKAIMTAPNDKLRIFADAFKLKDS